MVLPNHHHHPSYSSSSSSFVGDPMFSASSHQAYTSSLAEMFSLAGSGSGSSSAVSVTDPFFTLSSSGDIGRRTSENEAAALSEAQMQELERQRNMYKYMMASAPVPSEILTPFSMNPFNSNNSDVAKGSSLKLGIASNLSNNAADLEPWRCKRTDGKKWRCSRNVIPDQRYCERHIHKSRSRSRKHVESSQHNDTHTAKKDSDQLATTYPQFYGQPVSQFYVPSRSSDHHRELRWFGYKDEAVATLNPGSHEAVPLKVGSSRELKRGFDNDLNFKQKEPLVNKSFGTLQSLPNPNLTQHSQETRWFFGEGEQDEEAMGSSLTLSMAGEATVEEAEGTNQQQWISQEGPSWLCSTTLGGPLAEALCLGVSNNPSTSSTATSSCSRSSS